MSERGSGAGSDDYVVASEIAIAADPRGSR